VQDDICDDGRVTDALPDFTWLPDLALRTLGSAVSWANETCRRREPGHDQAIVRLGVPGVVSIEAIEVDGYPRGLA
jgi:allantoicase